MTTSRRKTEEKEHGGSLPHQPGPEKRNPGQRSRTDPWEGWTAARTNASRSPQRQPQVGDPSRRPKVKPTNRRESNVTIADWGRTQTWPETGDPTWRPGTPQDQGIQRHCSPMRASRQVPDKNQGTTSTAKPRRVDNQGLTLTTSSQQQTLEARGKNPSKDSKKIPGAWTTKRQEPPSENQDKGRRAPPKEGRNPGRIAAYQPKS